MSHAETIASVVKRISEKFTPGDELQVRFYTPDGLRVWNERLQVYDIQWLCNEFKEPTLQEFMLEYPNGRLEFTFYKRTVMKP
ncbi:MAG: hypothetical protein FWE01_02680 [Firmicutes bacterium]|nr:hypothetical protein [Bacillota bacterium]